MKYFTFLFLLFLFSGCQSHEDVEIYKEVRIKSPQEENSFTQKFMPSDFHTQEKKSIVQWNVPDGWAENAGSGMRMVTIQKEIESEQVEISVIELSGPAGGIEANLLRWLNQIGVSDSQVVDLLIDKAQKFKLAGDLEAFVYDFSFLKTDSSSNVILAGIINLDSSNLFIKVLTKKDNIRIIQDDFLAFIKSINISN